jgi:putative PIN family toxin of toxin-antitoxin system
VKVVFDTNIFVSAFAVDSVPAMEAITRVVDGPDRLAITRPILTELVNVLVRKFKLEPGDVAAVVRVVSEAAELVTPHQTIRVLTDKPDNRILECAVAVGADLIVTGDKAMLALKNHAGVRIVSLKEYLAGA